MTSPDVTIVIPTRDRWPRLEGTLRGALRQEGVTLEAIVVDDGSVDETPTRLAELPIQTQNKIINFGYGMAERAIRSYFDQAAFKSGAFPCPDGV